MSTLPDLFRRSNSLCLRPRKQGGIYEMHLTKSKQKSLLNVHPGALSHQNLHKNPQEQRAKTSCKSRQKPNHTRRWSSIGREERPSSQLSSVQRGSIFKISNHCSTQGTFLIKEPQIVGQEQSLKAKFQEILKQCELAQQILQSLAMTTQHVSFSLKDLAEGQQNQCKAIEEQTRNYLWEFHQRMSSMRKHTGMESKVNKRETAQLAQSLFSIGRLESKMESYLQKLCQQYIQ